MVTSRFACPALPLLGVALLAAASLGGCSTDLQVLSSPDAGAMAGTGTGTGGGGPTGGAGGTTSAGGGSAAGAGGAGGESVGPCATLALAGPAVLVQPPNVGEQTAPAVTLSSDDSLQASVAFQHFPYLDLYPSEVAYVSFPPWGAWPSAAIGPSSSAMLGQLDAFAVARTPGGAFNLLATPGSGGAGVWFVPRVGEAPPDGVLVEAAATRAAFVAAAGPRHLLGYESESVGGRSVSVTPVTTPENGAPELGAQMLLGAASSGPLPMDGVPSGEGWLVAFANGCSSPGCIDPELPGPPHAIHVVRLTDDGAMTTAAILPQGGPIAQIALVPRSDGAWLVWQIASGGAFPAVRAARITAADEPPLDPFDIVTPLEESLGFGVDAAGDGLAIAWQFAGTNARSPGLGVRRVGSDGQPEASFMISGPILTAPPSVVTSPDAAQILVAYGHLGDHPEVALARFDCAGAP